MSASDDFDPDAYLAEEEVDGFVIAELDLLPRFAEAIERQAKKCNELPEVVFGWHVEWAATLAMTNPAGYYCVGKRRAIQLDKSRIVKRRALVTRPVRETFRTLQLQYSGRDDHRNFERLASSLVAVATYDDVPWPLLC